MQRRLFFPAVIFTTLIFGIINSYIICVVSGVILFLGKEFTMNVLQKSSITGFLLVGTMLGSLMAGLISDKWGRKAALWIASFIYLVGGYLCMMASSVNALIAYRFFVGIGIGISSVIVPMYVAEVAPAKHRGRMVSLFQLAITMGAFLSYLANWLLADIESWRMALGLAFYASFFAFIALLMIHESPTWLMIHGKVKQAKKIWLLFRSDTEMKELIDSLVKVSEEKASSFKDLFQKGVRKPLFIGVTLSILQQFTGINAIVYYCPEIFRVSGIDGVSLSLLATMGVGAVNIIATLIAVKAIDRMGRKKLPMIGVAGMILSLFTLSLFFYYGVVAIVCSMLYVICFAFSLGPIVYVVASEIFPHQSRGRAMSLVIFLNWFSNSIIAFTFLSMMEYIGPRWSFSIFGVVSCITLWFFYKYIPETKGKTLEEIQVYWKK